MLELAIVRVCVRRPEEHVQAGDLLCKRETFHFPRFLRDNGALVCLVNGASSGFVHPGQKSRQEESDVCPAFALKQATAVTRRVKVAAKPLEELFALGLRA